MEKEAQKICTCQAEKNQCKESIRQKCEVTNPVALTEPKKESWKEVCDTISNNIQNCVIDLGCFDMQKGIQTSMQNEIFQNCLY